MIGWKTIHSFVVFIHEKSDFHTKTNGLIHKCMDLNTFFIGKVDKYHWNYIHRWMYKIGQKIQVVQFMITI